MEEAALREAVAALGTRSWAAVRERLGSRRSVSQVRRVGRGGMEVGRAVLEVGASDGGTGKAHRAGAGRR